MPQRADAPNTPKKEDKYTFSVKRAAVRQAMPMARYTHHGRVPQWYSVLITIGCQMPMVRKVMMAILIPVKYMSVYI
jgi:hypothetical protein